MAAIRLLIANCNNTLRQSIANPGGYINEPKDQQIIAGARNALATLDSSWDVVGVHNAGSVSTYNKETGKMFQTIEEAIAEQRYTLKLIRVIRPIKAIYLCPQAKGVGIESIKVTSTTTSSFTGEGFRLPMPGMIQLAIKAYSTKKTQEILYVGDDETDEEAANSLGIPFIYSQSWWKK